MKRILAILTSAVMVMMAISCEQEPNPTLSFGKSNYVLMADAPLTLEVTSSKVPAADLPLELSFTGSAVMDDDYTVSATSIVIPAGQSSATIELTPLNNFKEGKDIVVSIVLPAGYEAGDYATTTVAVEAKELLIYSFSTAQADVIDNYVVKLNITGADTGSDWVATEDMEIPYTVTVVSGEKSNAVFSTETLVLATGSNTAEVTVSTADLQTGSSAAVAVAVDAELAGGRFVEGDVPSITLNLKGILKAQSLLGTWTFAEVLDLDEIELWFMEYEDDPELLPTHNAGFTLTFSEVVAEDGTVTYKVKPSASGDWSNFFREAVIDYTAPINMTSEGMATGAFTSSEMNMFVAEVEDIEAEQLTYFSLTPANRSFDNAAEKLGTGVIAMRTNADGDLIIHLKDYDQPPFGFMWWDPGYDPDMFAFVSRFTKTK